MKNKMDKAKNKAKNKVAAKVGKKLGRNARECAKAAVVLVAFAALAALLTGCATTGEQPARSQTMTVNLDECTITINLPQGAEGLAPTLELMTQTQANEGSETISPTATPTNTTDTDASLDIPLARTGAASADAASAASDCPDCVDPACTDCEFK